MDDNIYLIKRKKNFYKFIFFIILFLVVIVLSFSVGRYPIKFYDVIKVILNKLNVYFISINETSETIIWNIRIPRVLAAILIGAGISTSGALFQGLFKNPMVSPDMLGATQGSAFGAALGILLSLNFYLITVMSFITGLISVTITYIISKIFKSDRILGLVLAGIMIGSIFSSGISFIKLIADTENQLPGITYWLMGSLASIKIVDVKFIFLPIIFGLIISNLYKWEINIFTMGEEEAKSLGVNTEMVRMIIIFVATLMTASSVSVSGVIGWIGLIIPHFTRLIFGDDYRNVIPASGIIGATFLLVVDGFCRNLATSEIPIGILTSFIGAPIFLFLIYKKGKVYDRD